MSDAGWIGVDLDGTLAHYDGWVNETHIGDPIIPMQDRVRYLLDQGHDVRIFTARVSDPEPGNKARLAKSDIVAAIQDWTEKHLGKRLPVTNVKDFKMWCLYDDRAIQVIPNTGMRVDGQEDYR